MRFLERGLKVPTHHTHGTGRFNSGRTTPGRQEKRHPLDTGASRQPELRVRAGYRPCLRRQLYLQGFQGRVLRRIRPHRTFGR